LSAQGVTCSGTISSGRRVAYQASVYSNGLIFANATVEINSNSASGFDIFGANTPNAATAPVSVFSSGSDWYVVSATRTGTLTLSVKECSSPTSCTVKTVSNMVCTTGSL
jgi:hypothetical protein